VRQEQTLLMARQLHTTRTVPAHRPNRVCGHCVPALRAGALLACPDAQRALLKPFLTSPPHPETSGEARSGTQQSASGQSSRAKPKSRSKSNPSIVGLRPPSATLRAAHDSTGEDCAQEEKQPAIVRAVWSACGLHLPRCARHTTAQASDSGKEHPASTPKSRCRDDPGG
jgi:hypothetical protein